VAPRHRVTGVFRALVDKFPVKSPRDLRKPRVVLAVAVLVALVGGGAGIAVAANHTSTGSVDVTADRADAADRANRDYDRTSASPSPSVSDSMSPSVAPSSPSPVPTTTAPKPTPTTPKATPKKTTAAPLPVPAGCSSYKGNQLIACQLLPSFGFSTSQMSSLIPMWNKESGWNTYAENSSSGAYGIPQALPGSKMGSVASDWRTNPATQIKWGLGYIKDRYGSPASAWSYWQAHGWY
jgi:cytoskeletal protein RodZ